MTNRILIVDDEVGARFMARLFLEEAGFVPDDVGSRIEALECCGRVDYDVVVLDYLMPGLSGMDVARELTESAYPASRLLFTGYPAPEISAEADRLRVPVVDKSEREALVGHVRELSGIAGF